MKTNLPVTDHEVKLENGQELVTCTDLKGIITYVNPDFIEVSGFSEAELLHKNHNVVRHPDMPVAAFKDLWDTLKLGRPWCKMVKNRCKNGDYYWVKANVTPIYRNGEIVEYMSVRTKPSEQEIVAASELYGKLNRKEATLPPPSRISVASLQPQMMRWSIASVVVGIAVVVIEHLLGLDGLANILAPIISVGVLVYGSHRIISDQVKKPLDLIGNKLRQVAEGDYHTEIPIEDPGEMGELQRQIKCLAIKLGYEVNNARTEARSAERVKVALDNVSSNVMLADNNGFIIYMNEAVDSMMQRAESSIREVMPDFRASAILGSNIDFFHANPAHQRQMIEAMRETFNSRIKIGSRHFDLIANPVIDETGTRLGTVVEWQDVTAQLAAERAIENLIKQASEGELDKRINADEYHGFMRTIADGVNALLDTLVEPLQEIQRVVNGLARGDLMERMDGVYQGDFERLCKSLNGSLDQLETMVTDIRRTGASISVGASEIATGNTTLSTRTESQAASLEETAASIEEMTSTVKQNADSSQEASTLALDARKLATQGGEISAKVVKSMGEISASSRKISEIIGVIDEIAFQTNLLALNAAVEAARAGEQGRGFAVVATEVRNLAQRSASAAKEIKELISDSVARVEEGAKYVDESGDALKQIMEAIDRVSAIVSDIASASREQAIGIEQVNTAVNSMDEGTQQNAALVEEVASASASMADQAARLRELVNQFKVNSSMDEDDENPVKLKKIRQLAAAGGVAKPEVKSPKKESRTQTPSTAATNNDPKSSFTAKSDDGDWEEF